MKNPYTSLIVSPEPAESCPEPVPSCSEDDATALLAAIEASLYAAQQAVLLGDISRLEQITGEQKQLQQQFAMAMIGRGAINSVPTIGPSQESFLRVLQLGRVQLALLDRAQKALRVLKNAVAGPQASYSGIRCEQDLPEGNLPGAFPCQV